MLLLFSNYFDLRGSHGRPILPILLLSLSIAAGSSISSSHKTSTQQQQQKQQPNIQQHQSHQTHMSQQEQAHLQQQQQVPSLHQRIQQQNTNSQMQQQEQAHLQQQQQVPSLHQRIQQQNTNSQMQQQEQNEQQLVTSQNLPSDISNTDYIVKDVDTDEEINDPYQYLSDLKMEPRLTTGNSLPWNPYNTGTPHQPPAHMPAMFNNFPFTNNPYATFGHSSISPMITPRFIPFFSYPQPVYMPLPMYLAAAASSDLFYPDFIGTGNELDDSMPRAIGDHRRVQSSQFGSTHTTSGTGPRGPPPPPPSARNSQIYFMRLAPMPYSMFMPGGLGFTAMPGSVPDPYNPLASAISPILNIPINFLANGKPTNIYQFGGTPNDFASSMQFNNVNPFGLRPPAAFSPAFSFGGSQRPSSSNVGGSFASQGSYGPTTATQLHSAQQQDSKLTLLKRPFFFNGRPDEIYTLPNNFNAIYSNSGYY